MELIYGSGVTPEIGPAEAIHGRMSMYQEPGLPRCCRLYGPERSLISIDRSLDLEIIHESTGMYLLFYGEAADLLPKVCNAHPNIEVINTDDERVWRRFFPATEEP